MVEGKTGEKKTEGRKMGERKMEKEVTSVSAWPHSSPHLLFPHFPFIFFAFPLSCRTCQQKNGGLSAAHRQELLARSHAGLAAA
jgi:hypothetical protein